MQEDSNQFERNNIWELVPKTSSNLVIGTRWVCRNKLDVDGNVLRNKVILIVKGYNQHEVIDFDETYALASILEAIGMLLALSCIMNFKIFQMDVKSAFLNGYIQEEVYIYQSYGFINFTFPYHAFKIKNALYGLKQAPKVWYDQLSKFLLENKFQRGQVDKTFSIKKTEHDILLVQIYVDDIIFSATKKSLCKDFSKIM